MRPLTHHNALGAYSVARCMLAGYPTRRPPHGQEGNLGLGLANFENGNVGLVMLG